MATAIVQLLIFTLLLSGLYAAVGSRVRRKFAPTDFVLLEETELQSKRSIQSIESRMSDVDYENYARDKYGRGMWADRLVGELLEDRLLELTAECRSVLGRIVQTRSGSSEPDGRDSLATRKEEGGAIGVKIPRVGALLH